MCEILSWGVISILLVTQFYCYRDDAPYSKLKVIVAGSLKTLLARQQKEREEQKSKVTEVPQEGVYVCACVHVCENIQACECALIGMDISNSIF